MTKLKVKRVEKSAWDRRDQFMRMAFLRYGPENLRPEQLINLMSCCLGNPDEVSTKKCLLYLRSGSPTCLECYSLFKVALPHFNPQYHAMTYRRWPILRTVIDRGNAPQVSDLVFDGPREDVPSGAIVTPQKSADGLFPWQTKAVEEVKVNDGPVVVVTGAGKARVKQEPTLKKLDSRITGSATPKAKGEHDVPEPPKNYKFLYVDTCGDCGEKDQRIVAWDMCWRCHWTWKHKRFKKE